MTTRAKLILELPLEIKSLSVNMVDSELKQLILADLMSDWKEEKVDRDILEAARICDFEQFEQLGCLHDCDSVQAVKILEKLSINSWLLRTSQKHPCKQGAKVFAISYLDSTNQYRHVRYLEIQHVGIYNGADIPKNSTATLTELLDRFGGAPPPYGCITDAIHHLAKTGCIDLNLMYLPPK